MDDSDFNNINVETLMQQFLKVKSLVTYSEVCMFGDKRLARDYRVAEFQVLSGQYVCKEDISCTVKCAFLEIKLIKDEKRYIKLRAH